MINEYALSASFLEFSGLKKFIWILTAFLYLIFSSLLSSFLTLNEEMSWSRDSCMMDIWIIFTVTFRSLLFLINSLIWSIWWLLILLVIIWLLILSSIRFSKIGFLCHYLNYGDVFFWDHILWRNRIDCPTVNKNFISELDFMCYNLSHVEVLRGLLNGFQHVLVVWVDCFLQTRRLYPLKTDCLLPKPLIDLWIADWGWHNQQCQKILFLILLIYHRHQILCQLLLISLL